VRGETDADELRALQRKAYGRGGQLTAAESQRLRALEDPRGARAVAAPVDRPENTGVGSADRERIAPTIGSVVGVPAAQVTATVAGTPEPPEAAEPTEAPDADVQTPVPPAPGSTRGWAIMTAVAATAVVLALGVGIGGALFAPRAASIPLTQEQQQRRGELAGEGFDPGSLRAVAREADALVWYATQDEGAVSCVILDVGAQSQTNCLATEQAERGLSAALSVPSESSGESVASDAVNAMMLLSTAGEPMVVIQRWGGVDALMAQFPEDVRDRAETLTAEGFELGLLLVGTFRSAPVWLGDRLSEQGATERCLIVDAMGPVVCTGFEAAVAEGIRVELETVDPSGAPVEATALELQFTNLQTPYLTVSVDSAAPDAVDDPVVIPVPPGDQIEIQDPGDGG
jgi:hypothetical protein